MIRYSILLTCLVATACDSSGRYFTSEFCDSLATVAVEARANAMVRGINEADTLAQVNRTFFGEKERQLAAKAVKYGFAHLNLSGDDIRWNVVKTCRATKVDQFLATEIPG